ncbi:MAG: hypothetical protein POELPBGB_00110 [Bacteroidia bacterium]|nr:hypothetical protein [Bacteroidia bacterium]
MAQRKRIGILFINRHSEWAGGNYYIYNLLLALKALPDRYIPHIVLFTETADDFDLVISETNYPYIEFLPLEIGYSFSERVVNKLSRIFLNKNIIVKTYTGNEAYVLFPYKHYPSLKSFKNKIYWIADFQDLHLPGFFSKALLENRRRNHELIAIGQNQLILSSNDALNDFEKFYPDYKCKINVLNFAVTHPPYDDLNLEVLLKQYKIKQPYFFSSNQFWAHKNHMVVLKAAKILKDKSIDFTIAFSGKETDSRNPEYFKSIKSFVTENKLETNIHFLGFMDRTHQLKLMKNAIAIIQPSLFEGWSTIVEDAKAMNQHILVSDLKVHREQLVYNADFFNPTDEKALAGLLEKYIASPPIIQNLDYNNNIINFGNEFLKIIP